MVILKNIFYLSSNSIEAEIEFSSYWTDLFLLVSLNKIFAKLHR